MEEVEDHFSQLTHITHSQVIAVLAATLEMIAPTQKIAIEALTGFHDLREDVSTFYQMKVDGGLEIDGDLETINRIQVDANNMIDFWFKKE